jgi:hypothetical protein
VWCLTFSKVWKGFPLRDASLCPFSHAHFKQSNCPYLAAF